MNTPRLAGIMLIGGVIATQLQPATPPPVPVAPSGWPLLFEPNLGQARVTADFVAHGPQSAVWTEGATIRLARDAGALGLTLVGGAHGIKAEGLEEAPARINYFVGNNPSKWLVGVPTYRKVRYRDIYSGIDLILYGAGDQLEYDLVVHPHADPSTIALQFEGAEAVRLDPSGDLLLTLSGSHDAVRQARPHIYQTMIGGRRQPVDGGYTLGGDGAASFWIAAYDHSLALTIDPAIVYASPLGIGVAAIRAFTVDGSGNTYLTGHAPAGLAVTPKAVQPNVRPPASQWVNYPSNAFIAKVDPSGANLVYATYLGGNQKRVGYDNGRSYPEDGYDLAVDAIGNVYVTGITQSTDFPTVNAFQSQPQSLGYGGYGEGWDGFVAKLNPTGSALMYSTYLGAPDGNTDSLRIAVDAFGSAYVASDSSGSRFPLTSTIGPLGVWGTFLTKFTPGGSVVYSTKLAGTDSLYALAVDNAGQAIVAGNTYDERFQIVNGWQTTCPTSFFGDCGAGFLAKVSASGSSYIYSTFLGGTAPRDMYSPTYLTGAAIDAFGNAYVTGYTSGSDFRTQNALQKTLGGDADLFLASFGPSGAIRYATYLGGSAEEGRFGAAIAADPAGNLYVASTTRSTDFPLKQPGLVPQPSGPVFRGIDRGAGWTEETLGLTSSVKQIVVDALDRNDVSDRRQPRRDSSTMYALTEKGVFKKAAHDTTWIRASDGLRWREPYQPYRGLAVDPRVPGTLYSATDLGVFKTVDGGGRWTLVYSSSVYYEHIVVDPASPSTVYAVGFGIVKTTDSGRTWHAAAAGLAGRYPHVTALFIGPDPMEAMICLADNVIYESRNGGTTWSPRSSVQAPPGKFSLVADPSDIRTLYANYENGGVFRSTDGGRMWTAIRKTGAVTLVAPDAQHTLYASGRSDSSAGSCLERSSDSGRSWEPVGGIRDGCDAGVFVAAVDPLRPTTILTGGYLNDHPFLARLAPDGSLLFSTYLPGAADSLQLAADPGGNAYLLRLYGAERLIKIAPSPGAIGLFRH